MSRKSVVSTTALLVCLGILAITPAGAQPTQDKPSVSEHHQAQFQMMKDMSQEMSRMTDEMSHGTLTPEQNKKMAKRMDGMSTMMHRMASLGARPSMREPEYQKQMGQMRKQMDGMMGDQSMMPNTK
ncbi:MAG: hypothetical protein ABI583_13070 [Betaproteobacteria bacterium]